MPHSREEAKQYIKTAMKKGYLRGKDEPMEAHTFRLPKRLVENLNIYCQQKDRSMSYVVRVSLEDFLSKEYMQREGI